MIRSRSAKILLPAGIVLVGVLGYVLLVMTRPAPPKRQAAVPRPLVDVFTVPSATPEIMVVGYGTVRAKRRISLVPQVSGSVVHKADAFQPGEFFDAGTVLLRIDETDYRLAAEKAAADVARAEYNLALAEEEAEVARREWRTIQNDSRLGGADVPETPNPLVFREPQLNLARAELAAARAAAERARIDLDRCVITTPFAGRVLDAAVDEGQYVRAGAAVGTIYATDVAEVIVSIPDADMAWIDVPQNSGGGAGSIVDIQADFAGQRHHWAGRAVRVAGAIDEQSRLVPIVIEIPDPYRRIADRPPLVEGMFVTAAIKGRPLAGAVAIPRAALRADDRIWVVDDEDRLNIRDVSVARAGIEQAFIAEGLAPGERVCLSNLQIVSDGMLVQTAGTESRERSPAPDAASAAAAADQTHAGGRQE